MQGNFWMWFAVVAVSAIGIYALGEGLTGLVMGQSCCTPSASAPCPLDSICPPSFDFYAPETETPRFTSRSQDYSALSSKMLVFEGIILVTASLTLLYAHLKRKMEKEN